MKNILFVGPYRQNDGWGNAAKEYIRALKETGYNIATRPVYMNSQPSWDKSSEFMYQESARYDSYDVIIQNCLPNLFRRYGGVVNIGLAYFESTINATPWPATINIMDRMWVSSFFEKNMLAEKCGVKIDIDVIPIPCDVEKYKKEYSFPALNKHKHEFKFYFVGEFIQRKNLNALITAFHREFKLNEQVRLILKLNRVGMDEETVLQQSQELIAGMKMNMGMYPRPEIYRSEIIIPKYLSQEDLYGLHAECDCFVMPSSGEAFCIPAFDASMFGSMPLVNFNSSMTEYLNAQTCGFVKSHEAPAIASDRPLPFLYNGRDTWYPVDVLSLQERMRFTQQAKIRNPDMKSAMRDYALTAVLPRYSYKSIAEDMVKTL